MNQDVMVGGRRPLVEDDHIPGNPGACSCEIHYKLRHFWKFKMVWGNQMLNRSIWLYQVYKIIGAEESYKM